MKMQLFFSWKVHRNSILPEKNNKPLFVFKGILRPQQVAALQSLPSCLAKGPTHVSKGRELVLS